MSDDETLSISGDSRPAPHPERQIGPYKLLSKLGEGGMGEVWLAEQETPRRQVALKVIKRGMDSRQVIARFETERQALAVMDHPNIARVIDAGQSEQGLPYFVMEYVKGEPINRYCDRHRLSMRERLELFVQVCDGVQHAHQKALIHRDLKPSNIMVTVQDEKPVPKIIDFGVAKATSQRLTERTLFTELGQMIGTPEYMSPEQAEMTGVDVDTRSDVYSLGVVLYELLAGALPFDPKSLREAGLAEIQRKIRDEEPPRPSTRVSTMSERSSAAAEHRRTDSTTLVRRLRGDLDWITMKALEKDRTRRYASPAELGADLLRHLRNEPVTAGPPSAMYRARKFVRRHRAAVVFVSVVEALLVALVIAIAVLSQRVASERDRANAEAATAREVTEFMVGMFEEVDPSRARGNEISAREVLDQGVQRIEDRLEDEPMTRATLLETMGRVYTALGLYDEARPLLDRSVEIREHGSASDPLALATALHDLGRLMHWQGEYEQGFEIAQRAVELRERHLGPGHPDLATALNGLGNFHEKLGRVDEAKATHERAIEIREKALGPDHADLAQSFHNLAVLYLEDEAFERSEELLRRSIAIEEQQGESHDLATSVHVLAILYESMERWDEALAQEERALAMREKMLGPDHPHVSFSLTTLGNIYRATKRAQTAEPHLRRALGIARASWTVEYGEYRWITRSLAAAISEQGRSREAEALLVDLIAESDAAELDGALTPTLNQLGELYRESGRLAEAERVLQRSLQIEERVSGDADPYVAEVLVPLARVALADGRRAAAVKRCDRALDIMRNARVSASALETVEESCSPILALAPDESSG